MLICQLTDLHVCAPGSPCNRVSETNMFTARAFRLATAQANRYAKGEPLLNIVTGEY